MNVLIWFRRDLRAADHPALSLAAGMGRVLPLYIVEPEFWRQAYQAGRHWAFAAESLAALREDLGALGAPLILRVGPAEEVLDRLCRQHHITRILSHAGPETQWSAARDHRLRGWAREAGVDWRELPLPAPSDPAAERPALSPVPGLEPGPIPTAKALKLAEDRCPHRQAGGRAQGLLLMDSFLARRGEGYRSASTSPLGAERASSRLSAHLAFGTLSRREIAAAATARQAERPGGAWAPALSAFRSHLALRDTLMQQTPPPAAEQAAQVDAARLTALERGETGLPFLDACLRYVAATGWLPSRLRGMVASVATGQLGLDWRAAGPVLARRFTDYDPSLFWPLLRQAVQTGAPCNPVRFGQMQDPSGAFTRAWVPELAPVPDPFLHTPWAWSGFHRLAGRRYPEALVSPGPRSGPRSGPRAAPALPRQRRGPTAQLCLDL